MDPSSSSPLHSPSPSGDGGDDEVDRAEGEAGILTSDAPGTAAEMGGIRRGRAGWELLAEAPRDDGGDDEGHLGEVGAAPQQQQQQLTTGQVHGAATAGAAEGGDTVGVVRRAAGGGKGSEAAGGMPMHPPALGRGVPAGLRSLRPTTNVPLLSSSFAAGARRGDFPVAAAGAGGGGDGNVPMGPAVGVHIQEDQAKAGPAAGSADAAAAAVVERGTRERSYLPAPPAPDHSPTSVPLTQRGSARNVDMRADGNGSNKEVGLMVPEVQVAAGADRPVSAAAGGGGDERRRGSSDQDIQLGGQTPAPGRHASHSSSGLGGNREGPPCQEGSMLLEGVGAGRSTSSLATAPEGRASSDQLGGLAGGVAEQRVWMDTAQMQLEPPCIGKRKRSDVGTPAKRQAVGDPTLREGDIRGLQQQQQQLARPAGGRLIDQQQCRTPSRSLAGVLKETGAAPAVGPPAGGANGRGCPLLEGAVHSSRVAVGAAAEAEEGGAVSSQSQGVGKTASRSAKTTAAVGCTQSLAVAVADGAAAAAGVGAGVTEADTEPGGAAASAAAAGLLQERIVVAGQQQTAGVAGEAEAAGVSLVHGRGSSSGVRQEVADSEDATFAVADTFNQTMAAHQVLALCTKLKVGGNSDAMFLPKLSCLLLAPSKCRASLIKDSAQQKAAE